MIKERFSVGEINPVIPMDFPDPDVIRVGDSYYMASTTMHFFPGCEILKSHDLLHWEHAAYVYNYLDSTDGQKLEDGKDIYGKGMWAPSLRYHNNCFYLSFCANDTGKTYLYRSKEITGPWKKQNIEGFYHDGSLLFDDDRVFIVYGNREIKIMELDKDLKGPKKGGLQRTLVKEEGNKNLSYEGSHIYKINERYYIFLIHSLPDRWMRTQNCFVATSLEGDFHGGEILCEDMGYFEQGVAQGGIVDTPDGHWYTILFQDRGGGGRMPVLLPLKWKGFMPYIAENGRLPLEIEIFNLKPEYEYSPLYGDDDFSEIGEISNEKDKRTVLDPEKDTFGLKSYWQWNHEPDISLVKVDTAKRELRLKTAKTCEKFDQARNTLTQRLTLPRSRASVILNYDEMQEGDRAGLGILCENYGYMAIEKTADGAKLIYVSKEDGEEKECASIPIEGGSSINFRIDTNTFAPVGNATFFWKKSSEKTYKPIPVCKSLKFTLVHFVGCRFALFMYSTKKSGGSAAFSDFKYELY